MVRIRSAAWLTAAVTVLFAMPATPCAGDFNEANPTVENVSLSFRALTDRGEWISFRRHPAAPANNAPPPSPGGNDLTRMHFQGFARVSRVGGPPYLYVTRAGKPYLEPPFRSDGTLMVVEMASRGQDGERMRSNRLVKHVETQDTMGPSRDRIVNVLELDNGAFNYKHPGGIQACGDILAVSMEGRNNTALPKGKIVFFDISNPKWPVPIRQLSFEHDAAAVGLAKESGENGRHVLVVAYNREPGRDRHNLDIYVSNGKSFKDKEFKFTLHTSFGGDNDPDFSAQSYNLVTQTHGGLFLIGAENLKDTSPFVPGKNRLRLWELFDLGEHQVGHARVVMLEYHDALLHSDGEFHGSDPVFGRQEGNFSAGAGAYVTPTGELLYYATEYYFDFLGSILNCGWKPNFGVCRYPSQNSLRLAELHHNKVTHTGTCGPQWRGQNPAEDHLGGPYTINEGSSRTIDGTVYYVEPWAHLFEDKNFVGHCYEDQASLLSYKCSAFMMDYIDQGREDFSYFSHLDGPKPTPFSQNGFNNQLTSFRWCGPQGATLYIYNDSWFRTNKKKGWSTFAGTGRVLEVPNIKTGLPAAPICHSYKGGVSNDHASSARIVWTPPDQTYKWSLHGARQGTLTAIGDGKQALYEAGVGSSTNEVRLNVYGETAYATVYVRNVPPSIDLLELDNPTPDEGATVTLTGTWSDPGATACAVRVNWGDGGSERDDGNTGAFGFSHEYGDNGDYTIEVCVSDDEDTACTTIVAEVLNLPPTVVIDLVEQPNPHFILPLVHTLAFGGSLADPGWLDTHSSAWDFGDGGGDPGTLVEENDPPEATGTTATEHVYAEPHPYDVALAVNDDDGGLGTHAVVLTVLSAQEAVSVLQAYIRTLPNGAFVGNPVDRKAALHGKLELAKKSIDLGMYRLAINRLVLDVRNKADACLGVQRINNWILHANPKDDWITPCPAQLDIRAMVDDLVHYLLILETGGEPPQRPVRWSSP